MAIPIASARRKGLALAEKVAGACVSAICYRRPEKIGVLAVVVAELKFRNIQAAYIWRSSCGTSQLRLV